MPSSTSNSSDRLTGKLDLRAWILGFVIILACELSARALGYRPRLTDSEEIWAEQRARVSQFDGNTVALIGTSRMQVDIDPKELAPYFPGKPVVMLAIAGRRPLAALEDLAEDATFRGVVICDIDPSWMLPKNWNDQRPYIDFYKTHLSAVAWIKLQLHLAIVPLKNFCFLHEQFSLARLIRGPAYRDYVFMRRDRFVEAQFDRVGSDLARLQKNDKLADHDDGTGTFLSPKEMESHYSKVEACVKALYKKGGRVIFVRMPTSGKRWESNQRTVPKPLYWDNFAARTQATCIHFKDYASLSGFDCPDTSHLDYRDSARFTKALGELIAREVRR